MQVQKHMQRCRGPVSCIDCSKVFDHVTVNAHTVLLLARGSGRIFRGFADLRARLQTCMSENDKYGKQTEGSGPANINRGPTHKVLRCRYTRSSAEPKTAVKCTFR